MKGKIKNKNKQKILDKEKTGLPFLHSTISSSLW
jgi:hypothetical protein